MIVNLYVVTSRYKSGESVWIKTTLESAANLVLDIIEEETADQVELLKQEGGDLSIVTHLEEKNYAEALRLYSEMTSSNDFFNTITIQ